MCGLVEGNFLKEITVFVAPPYVEKSELIPIEVSPFGIIMSDVQLKVEYHFFRL